MPAVSMVKVLDLCNSLIRPPGDAHDKRYNEGINYAAESIIKSVKMGNLDFDPESESVPVGPVAGEKE